MNDYELNSIKHASNSVCSNFLKVISTRLGVSKISKLRHIYDGAISCLFICTHMTVNKQINKYLVFYTFVHRNNFKCQLDATR